MELEVVVLVDQSHVVGLLVVQVGVLDDVDVVLVLENDALEDAHRGLGELDEVLGVSDDLLLLLGVDSLGHSAGNSHYGVGCLTADDCLDPLCLGPCPEDCSSELQSDTSDDSEDVPLGRGRCGSANEVGRCQCVEVRDVAVHEVCVVEQVPDQERCRGRLSVETTVDCLGGSEVVRSGADTAEPCGDLVELGYLPSDAESLEASQLGDLPVGVLDVSVVIKEDLDLSVSLETGDRVDQDPLGVYFLLLIPNDRCGHITDLLL